MKRIYPSLKSQGTLFAEHYIDDYLPEKHEIHAFEKLVEQLDLSPLLNSYGSEGGKLYNPKDMFSILLYSYLQGISSSIQISRLLREHLCFIKLSGKHPVSSRAIREFRNRNKELFVDLLSSSVKLCLESGLLRAPEVFGIDGSKIKAFASKDKSASIEKWEERYDRLIGNVAAYLEECAQSDKREEADNLEEQEKLRVEKIHEKLEEIKKRKEQRKAISPPKPLSLQKESKAELDKSASRSVSKGPQINDTASAQKALSKCSQIHSALEKHSQSQPNKIINISDPDAALMKNKGAKQPCYNVQIVSSLESQVIVAADVTTQENDQAQLEPMLDKLKDNLAIQNSDESEAHTELKVAADAGYNKGSNLESVDKDKGIDAYISMKDRSKDELSSQEARFLKENFDYDEDKDEWLCAQGKSLENWGNEIRADKNITVYAASRSACLRCPVYSKCVKTKKDLQRGYRTIEDDGFLIYRKQMRQKLEDEEAKKIYRMRSQVEAVFGQIKANRGFRSFRLQGLGSAKAEFMLMSLAHNMGKLMSYSAKGEDLAHAAAC